MEGELEGVTALARPKLRLGDYLAVLRFKDFRRLWFAQCCSDVAYHFLTFTLVIVTFQLTRSNAVVSALVVLVAIPPILFSTFAGVVADSYDRRWVLIFSNGTRFLLAAVALSSREFAPGLLLVAFFIAVVGQFFEPAQISSIPTLVPKEHLFTANSFFGFTRYAAFLVGYGIAGPMLHRFGEVPTFSFAVLLYGLATFFVLRMPKLDEHLKALAHPAVNLLRNFRYVWERFKEGFAFLRSSRVVLFIVFQVSFLFSIEKTFVSLLPSFSLDLLGFSVESITFLLLLPTGIGTLAGVLLANRLKRRVQKSSLITFGMFLDAFALLCVPFLKSTAGWLDVHTALSAIFALNGLVIAFAFLSGFADPFIIISAQTALQERTPNEKRGRLFGNQILIMNALSILPVLGIGLLATVVRLEVVIFSLGLLVLFMTFAGMFVYRRYALGTE